MSKLREAFGGCARTVVVALAALAALAALLHQPCPAVAASPVGGQLDGSSVVVECQELEDEQLAAIEARHLSALSVVTESGTLRLTCRPTEVVGTWSVGGEVRDRRTLSRKPLEDPVELLHWLASVLLEMRREGDADVEVATDSTGGLSAVAESSDHTDGMPSEEGVSSKDEGRFVASSEHSQGSAEGGEGDSPAGPRAALRSADEWVVGLGGAGELWATEVTALFGPRMNVGWRTGSFGLSLALAHLFGAGRAQGFGVMDTHVELLAELAVNRWLRTSGGAVLSLVTFLPPGDSSRGAGVAWATGAELLVGVHFPLGPVDLRTDLGALALAPVRELRLDGQSVLRVPNFQGLLVLGVELGVD